MPQAHHLSRSRWAAPVTAHTLIMQAQPLSPRGMRCHQNKHSQAAISAFVARGNQKLDNAVKRTGALSINKGCSKWMEQGRVMRGVTWGQCMGTAAEDGLGGGRRTPGAGQVIKVGGSSGRLVMDRQRGDMAAG